eukprot:1819980-Pleurochrysis_carterae.AAC.3
MSRACPSTSCHQSSYVAVAHNASGECKAAARELALRAGSAIGSCPLSTQTVAAFEKVQQGMEVRQRSDAAQAILSEVEKNHGKANDEIKQAIAALESSRNALCPRQDERACSTQATPAAAAAAPSVAEKEDKRNLPDWQIGT